MTSLAIRYVPLADVVPYDRNPKTHDVDLIVASIRRHGFIEPILICGRRDELASGHGRLKALEVLQRLHADHPDDWPVPGGIRAKGDTWLVPKIEGWSSANDIEFDAALVILNRAGEAGGWDNDALLAILEQQAAAETGLEALGFDLGALDALRAQIEADGPPADLTEDDGVDVALPAVPHTQLGDSWRIGEHLIVQGDSTDPAVMARMLDGRRPSTVWTDPPYGVAYISKGAKTARPIANDDLDLPQLIALLTGALSPLRAACQPGSAWYVACPAGPALHAFTTVLLELGIWRQNIVWVKDRLVLSRHDYHGQHETLLYGWSPDGTPAPVHVEEQDAAYLADYDEIVYGWTPGGPHKWHGGRKQTSVWHIPRPSRSKEHPTMKPIELVARSLINSTVRGQLVVDPFAGSGSTLVAAARVGRVGAGIELDCGYVDVIVRRLVAETGLQAVHADTGAEFPLS